MKIYAPLLFCLSIIGYSTSSAAYTTYARAEAADGNLGIFGYTLNPFLGKPYDYDEQNQTNQGADAAASVIYPVVDFTNPARTQAFGIASATLGVIRAHASAGSLGPFVSGLADAGFSDSFTIRGIGAPNSKKNVIVNYHVTGGRGGNSDAAGGVAVGGGQAIEFGDSRLTPSYYYCSATASFCTGSVTMSLPINTQINFNAWLGVAARAGGVFTSSTADFGNTGRVFLSLEDPSFSLVTGSGFDYSPVPLPASLWLFSAALCAPLVRLGKKKLVTSRNRRLERQS